MKYVHQDSKTREFDRQRWVKVLTDNPVAKTSLAYGLGHWVAANKL